jgi:hypothetical protein
MYINFDYFLDVLNLMTRRVDQNAKGGFCSFTFVTLCLSVLLQETHNGNVA